MAIENEEHPKPAKKQKKAQKKKQFYMRSSEQGMSKEMIEKNLKYFQKLARKEKRPIQERQEALDYLINTRSKRKKVEVEELDDDMDFGKSILFDDVTNDDGVKAESDEDVQFGDWNKRSWKKEKIIFKRKR